MLLLKSANLPCKNRDGFMTEKIEKIPDHLSPAFPHLFFRNRNRDTTHDMLRTAYFLFFFFYFQRAFPHYISAIISVI